MKKIFIVFLTVAGFVCIISFAYRRLWEQKVAVSVIHRLGITKNSGIYDIDISEELFGKGVIYGLIWLDFENGDSVNILSQSHLEKDNPTVSHILDDFRRDLKIFCRKKPRHQELFFFSLRNRSILAGGKARVVTDGKTILLSFYSYR